MALQFSAVSKRIQCLVHCRPLYFQVSGVAWKTLPVIALRSAVFSPTTDVSSNGPIILCRRTLTMSLFAGVGRVELQQADPVVGLDINLFCCSVGGVGPFSVAFLGNSVGID